jgi:hypothetical protein
MILNTEVLDINREEKTRNWNIEGVKELLQLIDSNLESMIFSWNSGEQIDITKLSNSELISLTFLELAPMLSGIANINGIEDILQNFALLTERYLIEQGKQKHPELPEHVVIQSSKLQAREQFLKYVKKHNFEGAIKPEALDLFRKLVADM